MVFLLCVMLQHLVLKIKRTKRTVSPHEHHVVNHPTRPRNRAPSWTAAIWFISHCFELQFRYVFPYRMQMYVRNCLNYSQIGSCPICVQLVMLSRECTVTNIQKTPKTLVIRESPSVPQPFAEFPNTAISKHQTQPTDRRVLVALQAGIETAFRGKPNYPPNRPSGTSVLHASY